MNYRCPVYKHCEGNGKLFHCTYARKGKQYKVLQGTPNCFKDVRRQSTIDKEKEAKETSKKSPKSLPKKAIQPKVAKLMTSNVKKVNIWDDIELTT